MTATATAEKTKSQATTSPPLDPAPIPPPPTDYIDARATPDAAGPISDADTRRMHHEATVSRIAGKVVAKYQEEGDRNFDIGHDFIDHAVWLKHHTPGFQAGDLEALARRIRDDVRFIVPIKADSIQIIRWASAYDARRIAAEAIGQDAAHSITFHEWIIIVGKGYKLNKETVEGTLAPAWLDFARDIAAARAIGRVTADDFTTRVKALETSIAEARKQADPTKAATDAASAAVKEQQKKTTKATKALTEAVTGALTEAAMSPEAAFSIIETVAKAHGKPLPAHVGFDPVRCTVEDCDLLANAMYQAGKFVEMKRLAGRLAAMIAAVEKMRDAAIMRADPAAIANHAERQAEAAAQAAAAQAGGPAAGRVAASPGASPP